MKYDESLPNAELRLAFHIKQHINEARQMPEMVSMPGNHRNGIERVVKLRVANGFVIRPLQRLYPLEMTVSDLPSDIALVENFPESNKDSNRLKPPEVPVPSLPAPNPVAEVLRPMK
ncbi:hypothetical protein TNIN_443361 [Trichonephila inaurata madagascariensis]|uniref:Uncharacterized protein n=1 Tax=Trichonephila inaurata madagascariensis TaxID=2747483 RepID=A0A8X6WNR9_9ARAC|nr:hypothetical protein TNIN_443361 [Trichonephila inaurata madagascariensis]